MASAVKQVISSSVLMHKLQREELLDGGSDNQNLNPNRIPRSRTPRSGNTPLHSPRSLSPLRSLGSTEIISSEIASSTMVDFQEAILRASHVQKRFPAVENHSVHEEAMDFQMHKTSSRASNPAEEQEIEALPVSTMAVVTRSRSENLMSQLPQPRHKSPLPPGRDRPSEAVMDQDAHIHVRSTRRVDALNQPSSELALLDKGKSPRRNKVPSSNVVVAVDGGDETRETLHERKSIKSSSRRTKAETLQEIPDPDLGMGDANRATRRTHTRPHTRQHKRKASEPITVVSGPSSPPEAYSAHRSPPLHHQVPEYPPPPYRSERYSAATSSPSTSSRRASREARTIGSSDWLQFVGDIIMWRHIPRSALLFGAGCFCIMSASLVQDMQYSAVSVVAYLALSYLAARFIKCNFLRRSNPVLSVAMITEADALSLVRLLLPLFNTMLQKLGDLFCGEPMVTLKVAAALWFLARAGSMMNMWTLARISYFALFTVPKCYSCYHEQIHGQARNVLHWVRTTWSACGHKRAVLFGAFAVAWNFSSVSTRVCGAFLALVGVRAYQHIIRSELEIGNNIWNIERSARLN